MSFVEAIGDDEQGHLIRERFEREGLDFRPWSCRGAPVAASTWWTRWDGACRCTTAAPADLQLPQSAWLPRGALAGAYACTRHGTAEAFIDAAALAAAGDVRT